MADDPASRGPSASRRAPAWDDASTTELGEGASATELGDGARPAAATVAGDPTSDAEAGDDDAVTDGAGPPLAGLPARPSYRWIVLGWVLLALASTNVTLTVLTAAARFIASDLQASAAVLSWVVAAPFLFRSVFVPTFGKVGDRIGRRRIFLVGLFCATFFSLLCGFAWNGGSLIAFRALAAVATAAVVPSALALIATVFAPAERIKAMGYFAATMALSPLIGVIVGGFVVEAVGWRWLFYAQGPLGGVAFVACYLVLRESRSSRQEAFDYRGSFWSVVGLSGLILALNQGPEWGWTSPAIVASCLVAVVAVPLFLRAETRAEAPIVPLGSFRIVRFSAALTAKFFAQFAYMGAFFLMSLFLADVLGYSPSEVALGVSPRAASLAIMGPIGGYLGARMGSRAMGVSGMVLIVGSMVLLGQLHGDSTYAMVLPGLVVAGFGLGLINPAAIATVTNSVDDEDLGVASGTVNLVGAIGASIGIAAMFAITNMAAGGADPPPASAYRVALWVGAVLCVLGLGAAFLMGGRAHQPDPGATAPTSGE